MPETATAAPTERQQSPSEQLNGLFMSELEAETAANSPSAPVTAAADTESPDVEGVTPENEPPSEPEAAPATATIAPFGMSEAERAVFSQLTPEMQAWVTSREQQRTADYTAKTQRAAADRKIVEAEYQKASSHQQQLMQRMQQYDEVLRGITDQPLQPPPAALAEQDPMLFQQQLADYLHAKDRQERAGKERARLHEEARGQHEAQRTAYVKLEAQKLSEMLPDFYDGKKGPALQKAVVEYAGEHGIPVDRLSFVSALEMTMLVKAMRYDAAVKAQRNARVVTTAAPRSVAPGPARAGGGTVMPLATAVSNLRQNGGAKALEAAFLAELNAERR